MMEFRYDFKIKKIKENNITGIQILAFDKLAINEQDHLNVSFEFPESVVTDKLIDWINIGIMELMMNIDAIGKMECYDANEKIKELKHG